jgi:galactose-1-phosphate uridylyltransferase
MVQIRWNIEEAKSLQTNQARNCIGFEDCVIAMKEGRVLDGLPHPTRQNQRILVLEINDYAYIAPYVIEDEGIFLKTVFPSRKHHAKYLGNK